MENIILFGSSGFIGNNLKKFFSLNGFTYKAISLRDLNWKNNIDDESLIFINLIGKAHDHKNLATEKDFYFANYDLTKEVFNEFLLSSAFLFIHVSSIAALEEYESIRPLTEDDECHPETWYGKSKRLAEKWLLEQKLPSNKRLIILRPPMVHGPGDKGNLGILYNFISKGIPYPFAGFKNSRSFISINNFIFYIEEIIKNPSSLESGIYHISDDETISTEEILEIIKCISKKRLIKLNLPTKLIEFAAKIGDFIPIPINNKRLKKLTSSLIVSNSKINSRLNVEQLPETTREGIKRTLEWLKSNN